MAAYRSLARSRNVDLHTVLRVVEENRLADVVRLPDRGAELRALGRAIARRDWSRETTTTPGISVPARMRFTAAELTEIERAFRQHLATDRVPKKPARGKRKAKPPSVSVLVREADYHDTYLLTPALVSELFAVAPRIVRRWSDSRTLPSFRTVGGQRRFR
jgi:hypothetical protein